VGEFPKFVSAHQRKKYLKENRQGSSYSAQRAILSQRMSEAGITSGGEAKESSRGHSAENNVGASAVTTTRKLVGGVSQHLQTNIGGLTNSLFVSP